MVTIVAIKRFDSGGIKSNQTNEIQFENLKKRKKPKPISQYVVSRNPNENYQSIEKKKVNLWEPNLLLYNLIVQIGVNFAITDNNWNHRKEFHQYNQFDELNAPNNNNETRERTKKFDET